MNSLSTKNIHQVLIKKCHICGQIHESTFEIKKCVKCNKSFLPLNYFDKIHDQRGDDYEQLFTSSDHLTEEDMITGLYVLW